MATTLGLVSGGVELLADGLIVFPGGHHRSLQHDLEVQNLTLRFIAEGYVDGGSRPRSPRRRLTHGSGGGIR